MFGLGEDLLLDLVDDRIQRVDQVQVAVDGHAQVRIGQTWGDLASGGLSPNLITHRIENALLGEGVLYVRVAGSSHRHIPVASSQ